MALRRIQQEFEAFSAVVPSAEFDSACSNPDNLFEWRVIMNGPPNTPYEEGKFLVIVIFPPNYPDQPLNIRFASEIQHPVIGRNGEICICYEPLISEFSPSRPSPLTALEVNFYLNRNTNINYFFNMFISHKALMTIYHHALKIPADLNVNLQGQLTREVQYV